MLSNCSAAAELTAHVRISVTEQHAHQGIEVGDLPPVVRHTGDEARRRS